MKRTILLTCVLALLGTLAWLLLGGGEPDAAPTTMTWSDADVEPEPPSAVVADAEGPRDSVRDAVDDPATEPGPAVTRKVHGRVVDPSRIPQAGAEVRIVVTQRRADRGDGRVAKSVTTDEYGEFRFAGPGRAEDRVHLLVSRADFASHAGFHEFRDATSLDLGDIVLQRGGAAAGYVVDSRGQPIGGASVTLEPSAGNRLGWTPLRDAFVRTVETDDSGGFRFEHLTPSSYRVAASARGMQHGQADSPVRVDDEASVDVGEIVLADGIVFAGIVFDPDGDPVEGANVRVGGMRRGLGAKSGADGRFEFAHLPREPIDLEVQADGFVSYARSAIDPWLTPEWTVQLEAGLTIAGQVVDAAGGAPVERFAVAAQRVRGLDDATPEAEADALRAIRERMERTANRESRADLMERLAQAERRLAAARRRLPRDGPQPRTPAMDPPTTHAGGRYELTGLDEGVWRVFVESAEHQVGRSREIELRRGVPPPPVDFALERGVTIRGTVLSSQDESPLADAVVELYLVHEDGSGRPLPDELSALRDAGPRAERLERHETDSDGGFEFSRLEPTLYELRVRLQGFTSHRSAPFRVDAIEEAVVRLEPAARISGHVTGHSTDRLDEVRVFAFAGLGRGELRQASIDEGGAYLLEDVQPGEYVVRAFAGDQRAFVARNMRAFATGRTEIDLVVTPGGEYELDLVAEAPSVGSVVGSIRRDGRPAVGARLRLRRTDPGELFLLGMPQQSAGQDGQFRFDRVEAGEYALLVHGDGAHARTIVDRLSVSVTADSTTEVHSDYSTCSVRGTVRSASDPDPLDGRLYVLPGVTEVPSDLRQHAREHPMFHVVVRGGEFAADGIRTGIALFVLEFAGTDPTSSAHTLVPGENRVDLALE